MKWFVKHPTGILIVILVYLMFLQIYGTTFYFCILSFESILLKTVHAILFTFLTFMAFWAHLIAMTTNPGVLPLHYKTLDENKVTLKFAALLDERESLYIKPQVGRLMRQGKVEDAKVIIRES